MKSTYPECQELCLFFLQSSESRTLCSLSICYTQFEVFFIILFHILLQEIVGLVGGKLHTGRSRNDQVMSTIIFYVPLQHFGLTAQMMDRNFKYFMQARSSPVVQKMIRIFQIGIYPRSRQISKKIVRPFNFII